jgi:hypothetical protein
VITGRKEVGRAEILDIRALRRQGFMQQRMPGLFGDMAGETRANAPLGIEQNDIAIDGVFGDVFGKAGLNSHALRACRDQELAHVCVGGEKADIGGAFEQVAHQNIDAVLRLGAQFREHFLSRFKAQMIEQLGAELLEGFAGARHLRRAAGQLAEQGQCVPRRLQASERLAIILDTVHVSDESDERLVDLDILVNRH